ncbi:MAG TPA: TetR/AcrR family transcriptional regulator [Dongiaceae bacterium]|nr:TetR/AcrR family transcriptional regulator [Dongiaceae bacterium]
MNRPRKPLAAPTQPTPDQPKWRRRAADRPGEILDAALSVFIAKGFAATKLDDVAAAAGISKGLLYRYFDNKAELFKAMVRAMLVSTIRNAADQLTRSVTAMEALDFFMAQMKAVAGDPRRSAIPKLIISESGNFPEIAIFYLTEVINPALTQLTALIKRGVESGEFRKVDPVNTARILVAPFLMTVIWRHTFAQHEIGTFDPDALINQHREILLSGLAADGAKPAKRGRRSS